MPDEPISDVPCGPRVVVRAKKSDGTDNFVTLDGCAGWPLKTPLYELVPPGEEAPQLFEPSLLIPREYVPEYRILWLTPEGRYVLAGAEGGVWDTAWFPPYSLDLLSGPAPYHHDLARIPLQMRSYYEIAPPDAWDLITRSGYQGGLLPPDLLQHLTTVGDPVGEFLTTLRSKRGKKPSASIRLIMYMKDRATATLEDLIEAVHGDNPVDKEAVEKLVTRTNKLLQHSPVPWGLKCDDGGAVRVDKPRPE